jgi:deoxyribodipyrimidine photo-lyase
MKIAVYWFRRDLRLEDNTALHQALNSGLPVLPIFIFERNIIRELPPDDSRVSFIYSVVLSLHDRLRRLNSSLLCFTGDPVKIWEELLGKHEIARVFINRDYEPCAIKRDNMVKALLNKRGIEVRTFKDQVIFEENEIVKDDGKPYTIYTPYKNRWRKSFRPPTTVQGEGKPENFCLSNYPFPKLADIGFRPSSIKVRDFNLSELTNYAFTRDIPSVETSHLGPHLRFGTVSLRQVIASLDPSDETFLNELIWREFFMQILYHFPNVVNQSFKPNYNGVAWNNDESEFAKWCQGNTGYPLVDAGMRQLNATGFMHNRVRMVTASFLCKHLLIDWRWGEAYFASKLLDYELASNNGNWQWAASTGCDAAPYFRIFNPTEQLKKFDKDQKYVKKWVAEYGQSDYPAPIIGHEFARQRALRAYKMALTDH